MSEHVVPHLVSHHHEKLLAIQLRENRVPQHDALGRAKAGDIGIDRVGVFALGDLEYAAALDSRALGQLRMSASSVLSFIGPNVLNSGSIQIG